MNHTIRFDTTRDIAYIHYLGEVQVDESAELLREIVRHPDWNPRVSRVITYDDALLGGVDQATLNRIHPKLSEIISTAYQGAPNYLAHVCSDPLKGAIIDYWVTSANGRYPASLTRVNSVAEALAWIERKRSEETG